MINSFCNPHDFRYPYELSVTWHLECYNLFILYSLRHQHVFTIAIAKSWHHIMSSWIWWMFCVGSSSDLRKLRSFALRRQGSRVGLVAWSGLLNRKFFSRSWQILVNLGKFCDVLRLRRYRKKSTELCCNFQTKLLRNVSSVEILYGLYSILEMQFDLPATAIYIQTWP